MKRLILPVFFIFSLLSLKGFAFAESSDLIRVTVPESGHVISTYTINGKSDIVVTYNKHNKARFSILGRGEVVLNDQFGNVYFNTFKDSTALEDFTVDFALLKGVGNYSMTLRISEEGKGTASRTIALIYKPLSAIFSKEKGLEVEPDTWATIGEETRIGANNYIYFLGFAFTWLDIILWILIIIIVLALLGYVYYRVRRRRARAGRKREK